MLDAPRVHGQLTLRLRAGAALAVLVLSAPTLAAQAPAPAHVRVLPIEGMIDMGLAPSTQLRHHSEFPSAYTRQWDTAYETYHVLRRRSDGAVRVWRHRGSRVAADRASVAADPRDMLRVGASQQAPTGVP